MTGNDGSSSFCCKGVLYCVLLYFLVIPLFDSSFFINSRSHFVDRDEEKFSKQLNTGITRELLRDDHHGEEGKLVWTIFINISESMREKKGMKERGDEINLLYGCRTRRKPSLCALLLLRAISFNPDSFPFPDASCETHASCYYYHHHFLLFLARPLCL